MTDFKNRLDRLASQATRNVRLANPATSAGTPARPRPWVKLGGVVVALALLIGGFLAIGSDRGNDSEEVVVADKGETSTPPAATYCAVDDVLPLLRSGLPTYDYRPAGSFADLAATSDVVVTGTVTEIVRNRPDGDTFTELSVGDVVAIDGQARPDITIVAYDAVWDDTDNPDPIALPMGVEGVDFIAFLTPWSGRRGDWAPGIEGLYVACGDDLPAVPVIENAAGPDDPTAPTITELRTLLTAPDAEPTVVSDEPMVDIGAIECVDQGSLDQVATLLGNGMTDNSTERAGSYAALARQSDAVATGGISSVQRLVANASTAETYTVLEIDGIAPVDGRPLADLTQISYVSRATDADPLAEPVTLTGVNVVAFVNLDRTFPGGLRIDGTERLYVACGTDTPATPVYRSGAGPDDPVDATLDQIAAIVAAVDQQPTTETLLPAAEAIRDALVQFADGEALAIEEIPLDTEVALVLGDSVEAIRTKTELRDPSSWTIDRDEFEGYAGPFSALDLLAGLPETVVTLGDHPRCVAEPTPAPLDHDGLVRISIQPIETSTESCLQWFAVDLFFDPEAGAIRAIALDLYGP